MKPEDYTPEMQKDINERVGKAAKMLEDLKLHPQASVSAVNNGDDTFALKVVVYLQDLKFKSPIQAKDLK